MVPSRIEKRDEGIIAVQSKQIRELMEENARLRRSLNEGYKPNLDVNASPQDTEDIMPIVEQAIVKPFYLDDLWLPEAAYKEVRKLIRGYLYHDDFIKLGIEPTRKLFLYGPPGTGKTSLAKAIATAVGYFVEIPWGEIATRWYGQTERNLEKILKSCKETYETKRKPVVVFIDEADVMFQSRKESIDDATKRVVGVWLRWLDGMVDNEGLIFVAASNNYACVDDAIKRSGRFGKSIEMPFPNEEGVYQILFKNIAAREREIGEKRRKIGIKEREVEGYDARFISSDINYLTLAKLMHSKSFTGADINLVINDACEGRLDDILDLREAGKSFNPADYKVRQMDLERATIQYAKMRSNAQGNKEKSIAGYVKNR